MHCLPFGHRLVTLVMQKTVQALRSTSAVTAIKWASVVLIRLSCVKCRIVAINTNLLDIKLIKPVNSQGYKVYCHATPSRICSQSFVNKAILLH